MKNTKAKTITTIASVAVLMGAFALMTGCKATPSSFNLGSAGNYAVLAKSAVSTTGTTSVTGNIGLSPAAASYLTGFGETLDASNKYATSTYVTGKLYASDYAAPTPANLTTAVADMETAYTTGNGFAPTATELYAGDLSGQTMEAGVYKYSSNVLINSNLTLHGGLSAVWVFQIAGTLTQAADIDIILSGGANASNIFWLVADSVFIGTGAHAEGSILGVTDITMGTGSSINGRLLAQTAVNLDATTVVA